MGRTRVSNRQSPRTEQEKLDAVLALIHSFHWTLGYFLLLLFSDFEASKALEDGTTDRRTRSHSGFVKNFLAKESTNQSASLDNILALIYNHPDGTPTRNSTDTTSMARPRMLHWALSIVQDQAIKEATNLANRTNELRLPSGQQDWENIIQFSLEKVRDCIVITAPLLYSLAVTVASSPNRSFALMGDSDDKNLIKTREPELVS